jgi:hypothetical protein
VPPAPRVDGTVMVPLAGLEPTLTAPEADALSAVVSSGTPRRPKSSLASRLSSIRVVAILSKPLSGRTGDDNSCGTDRSLDCVEATERCQLRMARATIKAIRATRLTLRTETLRLRRWISFTRSA